MAKLSVSRFDDRAALERHYIAKIDTLAEEERQKHITPGHGQSMTYEIKLREALSGGGPVLQAEADALGVTLQTVIDSVIAANNAWVALNAAIEARRIKLKRDIRGAGGASEMHAIAKQACFDNLTLQW